MRRPRAGTWDDGKCASIVHPELVDAVQGLLAGETAGALKLPRAKEAHAVPVTALGELGARGLLHRDISGIEKKRTRKWGDDEHDGANDDEDRGGNIFRGPFDIVTLSTETPTYPALWGHEADRERFLVVQPDREGRVRERCAEKADAVWETATRLHFTLDFRLNSQSLAACLTPMSALGGRAWPNFLLRDRRDETATVLWANTTLGLILFWWAGTTQQAGRSNLTISRLPDLRTLDARALSDEQHARAQGIFDAFRDRPFLPANEAWRDPTRQDLDEAVLVDLLDLPGTVLEPLALLRRQWCSEPTVHGGKATRPEGFET